METRHLARLQFTADGPAVEGEWTVPGPAKDRYATDSDRRSVETSGPRTEAVRGPLCVQRYRGAPVALAAGEGEVRSSSCGPLPTDHGPCAGPAVTPSIPG